MIRDRIMFQTKRHAMMFKITQRESTNIVFLDPDEQLRSVSNSKIETTPKLAHEINQGEAILA